MTCNTTFQRTVLIKQKKKFDLPKAFGGVLNLEVQKRAFKINDRNPIS